jgi:hypothetical protein
MIRAINYLLLSLLLMGISSVALAQGNAQVDAGMSGSWFDPDHDGEGFLLEVLENRTAVIYWFTYDESGQQRWFTGVGAVIDDSINFESLLLAEGPEFGEGFNPDQVEYTDAGELTIQWADCNNAAASYRVNGVDGSQQLIRLSTLAGLECPGPVSSASPLSGSWFDQTHDGEGLVIEALDNASVVVFWFSYDAAGRQAWFYGVGEQNDTGIMVDDVVITRGGRFGPDFNPDDVVRESWGSLQIELGCDYGKLDYSSSVSGYGEGKQTLTRLTSPGNPQCEEPQAPNILLVIADNLGKDASNQYGISAERPLPTFPKLAVNE